MSHRHITSVPCLTDEQRAAYSAQLKEAQQAYHNLMTGQMVRVVLDQNGERVEFTSADKGQLYNYILTLQAMLGLPTTPILRPAGPATFIF